MWISSKYSALLLIDLIKPPSLRLVYLFPSFITHVLFLAEFYKIEGHALIKTLFGEDQSNKEIELDYREYTELELIDKKHLKIAALYELNRKHLFEEKDDVSLFLEKWEKYTDNILNLFLGLTIISHLI